MGVNSCVVLVRWQFDDRGCPAIIVSVGVMLAAAEDMDVLCGRCALSSIGGACYGDSMRTLDTVVKNTQERKRCTEKDTFCRTLLYQESVSR